MDSSAAIEQSPAFRKWRDAFRKVAGVKLHLLDGDRFEETLREAAEESPLCGQICGRCLRCTEDRKRFRQRLRTTGVNQAGPFAMRCSAGLTVAALPVLLATETTAFLYSGPVILYGASRATAVEGVTERISSNGTGLSRAAIRKLARRIPMREKQDFNAAITLMGLLAEQIAHMSRQMLEIPDRGVHEAYVIRRAAGLIDRRFSEDLHIDQVASELGVSRSYLSHLFHRLTGLTFTDYLAGRRVVEVKRLLIDSQLRITEILFAAGFQSVSQANRVFRATTGMAPSEFRARSRG